MAPGAILRRHAAWLALPFGALHSLAFAPVACWPLGLLGPALLWAAWEGASAKRAAALGFGFGAGLFLAGTYWLYTSIHTIAEAPLAIALVLLLGLVALMASYTALLGALAARFTPEPGPWRSLAVLPAGWVLAEWLRGWLLSGFPWLAVGYSQIDTPLAGYAPVFGIYGVSLITALSAGALLAAIRATARARVALGVLLVALWGGGALLARIEWTHPVGAPLSVALVQGAIAQDNKWEDAGRQHAREVYGRLTREAIGARLIVWPESALPELYHEAMPFLLPIYNDARAHGSDLLLGQIRYDLASERFRNGLVALSDEEQWYYKRRLVPFGEFFPVPAFVRGWMAKMSLGYVDFLPGNEAQPPLVAAGQRLAATICYEDAYAVEQLAFLGEATLLVNVSNDAWFGDSTAPHQHLQIARMRALEAGRWLMRATNNGISAVVDPRGRVMARSAQFAAVVLRGEVVPYAGLTPYARMRNWPVLGGALALLVAAALARRRVA
jgi:apolipoprotein N-acyltransferase